MVSISLRLVSMTWGPDSPLSQRFVLLKFYCILEFAISRVFASVLWFLEIVNNRQDNRQGNKRLFHWNFWNSVKLNLIDKREIIRDHLNYRSHRSALRSSNWPGWLKFEAWLPNTRYGYKIVPGLSSKEFHCTTFWSCTAPRCKRFEIFRCSTTFFREYTCHF